MVGVTFQLMFIAIALVLIWQELSRIADSLENTKEPK